MTLGSDANGGSIENANSHPYRVTLIDDYEGLHANSHPYQVEIVGEGGLGVSKGYFYNGAFYKDEAHTELITPKEGQIFYDLTSKVVYIYDGETYRNIGESSDSDVVDIVNTYVDLQNYPTASLKDNAIIKVLADETHEGKIAYYRWNKGTSTWNFIGAQGPYYTKAQTDELLAGKEDVKPYTSLVRNSEYLYTVTFDTLPAEGELEGGFGACSAFVRDGKLYRNLDWNYDENLSFHVITKNFEGMSFVGGLTNDNLDLEKIAQLPYRVVDGVNKNGIMVSTHVLYNDWSWSGTGSNSLMKLPFLVLENVKSMATIATDLGSILSNLYAPEAMLANEYLIQVLVTDGTTTYILAPSTTTGNYELINATSNPKLTNFRWVSDATVIRTNLQTRPQGVERWNLIDNDTKLEDLRFTIAYESPNRLSEFIGIDGTTKDSTDAELEAIYDEAHVEYEDRERDGKTWQTMHSVVYSGKGIENLYVQEDWAKDYTYATKEYVDNAVASIDIPELLPSTGQSEVAGMTQKAITDALENAGGVKILTTADYNYPVDNPDGVAFWLLPAGAYRVPRGINFYVDLFNCDTNNYVGDYYISHGNGNSQYIRTSHGSTAFYSYRRVNTSNGNTQKHGYINSPVDNLTTFSEYASLSAKQGKVLKDLIDALTTRLGGLTLVSLTQAEYDALTTKDANTLYVITEE